MAVAGTAVALAGTVLVLAGMIAVEGTAAPLAESEAAVRTAVTVAAQAGTVGVGNPAVVSGYLPDWNDCPGQELVHHPVLLSHVLRVLLCLYHGHGLVPYHYHRLFRGFQTYHVTTFLHLLPTT